MNSVLLRACAAALNGAALLLATQPALAAETIDAQAAPESANLAEVVVTAQKRAQRAQDVPISLSVMSGSDLESSSIKGVTDALGQVPGVAVNFTGQGGETQLAIRGVTASGALFAGPSPIAYYLDSVPFGLVRSAIEPDANTYDLNRIEVLRGPQGTLYGASALNGVVRVITNDADLNQFDFKARAGLSSTDSGGGNWRDDMEINLPIVEGRLAARLVVGQEHDSGWIDTPLKNNINDDDLKNVRLKVTALPLDDLTIKLSADHRESTFGAPSEGLDDYSPSIQNQSIATRYNTYNAKVEYEAPWFSVSSASSYLTYLNDGALDLAPGTATPVLTTRLQSRVFSEEINLNSKLEGPWRWSAGAFYRDARDSFYQTLGDLIPAPVDEVDTSRSGAVFGEVGRRFLDNRLELAAGVRYFHDDVGMQQLILFGQPPGSPLLRQTDTFNATTPRVVLSWFPNHDLTMYASYSEGFRSGYPQSELVQVVDPNLVPVKPDKLHNYEVGGKGNLFDNRLTFDAAVYYMKWDGIQQNLGIYIPGSTAYIVANVNGQSASGMGVDFAVTARPVKGLELGLNFSWNGLSEDSAVYSSGQLLFPSGARIDSSPAYTAGANAQYSFPFGGSGWDGELSASARYTSLQTTTNIASGSGLPPVVVESNTMTTGRVSFTVIPPSHWRLMLFCDNVGNNRGVPLASTTPYLDNSIRPRTVGVQVDYSYK
ncbi:MAG TPA: TonB-dependent receptor [Steroidobacteraceae bacterium]|nr:TonB-dependent receptor [Steroidobacteraceae bacterium]